MTKPKLWTKNFIGISLTSFFIFLVFYMLTVILPLYVTDEIHGDEKDIGIVATLFVVAGIILRPFTGKWLDSVGQKKVLMIGVTIFLIGTLLYLGTKSLPVLLLTRLIQGIGFGISTTATGGIVANVIPNQRRGEGMGYYATSMNLAMVIGPLIGLSIMNSLGHSLVFLLCAIFSFMSFLCAAAVKIPQSIPKQIVSSSGKEKMHFSLFFEKKAIPISIAIFTLTFVYSGVISFISVYAKEVNLVQAASFFFVVYAACLLSSRPFTGKWFDEYGENTIIYPSIILFAIGVLALSQASSTFLFLLAGGLIGLGFGTISSSFQSIAIKSSPANRAGTATSTYFVLFDSGFAVGSFLLGILAANTSYATVYLLGFFIILLSLGIYYLLHGRIASDNISSSDERLSV
jgi:MFS family permease